VLWLPSSDDDLLRYRDWIAGEVLAISIELSPVDQLTIERA
jgi:hypothetical protein